MANKKLSKKVTIENVGQAHIHASFNNIIMSITNTNGQVVTWSSAGKIGFRGSKKNTPYAALKVAEDCGQQAFDLGIKKISIFLKGPGSGRESAIRTLSTIGFELLEITDVTPLPHNGCRPPKRRRV